MCKIRCGKKSIYTASVIGYLDFNILIQNSFGTITVAQIGENDPRQFF